MNWTKGNGQFRDVFVKQGISFLTSPIDSVEYIASSDWSNPGTQIGSTGYYCVYNRAGTA